MKLLVTILSATIALGLCKAQEAPITPVQEGSRIAEVQYYFDRDPGSSRRNQIVFPAPVEHEFFTIAPSTDNLQPGPHTLYIRLRDEADEWSHPTKYPFFVFPKFQATSFDWEIKEEQTLLASGTQALDPISPQTQTTIESPITIAGSESKEILFQARLTLNDSVPTGWEEYRFVVTDVAPKPDADTDGDGIIDRAETGTGIYVSPDDTGTDPELADSDGDSIPDGDEIDSPLNPNVDDTALIQFFANRTQILNLPAPTLARNENGEFEMRLMIETSQDLNEWFQLIFNDDTISTENGQIKIQLPSENQSIQFYQLQVTP